MLIRILNIPKKLQNSHTNKSIQKVEVNKILPKDLPTNPPKNLSSIKPPSQILTQILSKSPLRQDQLVAGAKLK